VRLLDSVPFRKEPHGVGLKQHDDLLARSACPPPAIGERSRAAEKDEAVRR